MSEISTNVNRAYDALVPELERIGREISMKFTLGAFRYDRDGMRVQLKIIPNGNDGEPADQIIWNRHAPTYGFREDDFGRIIKIDNECFEIAGFKPSARKYHVVIKSCLSGKMYHTSIRTALKTLRSNN